MAEILLPGLATGIDTSSIVKQLMEVNRKRLNRMQRKMDDEDVKIDALDDLETELEKLESASSSLANSTKLKSFEAVSSDEDVLTLETTSDAVEGSYRIQVKQLATSERWIQDGYKYKTSYVNTDDGNGMFVFTYNHQELQIPTTASMTLEDLAGKINNDADNPGITASILKYDAGNGQVYHLVLNGQSSGTDYQISVNDSQTEIWKSDSLEPLQTAGSNAGVTTQIKSLTGFEGTIDGDDVIRIQGTTHLGVGVDVTFSLTNYTTIEDLLGEINEAFEDASGNATATATYSNGIITFFDETPGATSLMEITDITIENGGSDAAFTFPSFAESQNGEAITPITGMEASTFTQTQSAQDSKIKVDGYPPSSSEVQTWDTSPSSNGGNYTLSYGGQTTAAIAYDATAAQIQTKLEALSTVSAGDITVSGTGPHDTADTVFTFRSTLGDVGLITWTDIDLSGGPGPGAILTTTPGADNWITRSTNSINDAITGVTIKLHDNTLKTDGVTYDSIDISLNRDTETLKTKMEELVTAYNDVMKFLKENIEYDAKEKTRGVFYGDYTLTSIKDMIRTPFLLAAKGFTTNDSFIQPKDVGLTFNADKTLKFDSKVFDEAIVDDYLGVLDIIGALKTGSTSDASANEIKFLEASSFTTAGIYHVKVNLVGGVIDTSPDNEPLIWKDGETEADGRIGIVSEDNIITGDISPSALNSNQNPIYDEYGLQFTIDLTAGDGPYEATIYVKQGFAGNAEDYLETVLDSVEGIVPIAKKNIAESNETLQKRIDQEEARLVKVEDRLVKKFARLEKLLSMINYQMAGLGL